jgi:hypothetical protein
MPRGFPITVSFAFHASVSEEGLGMRVPEHIIRQAAKLAALTALFALLNYVGAVLYQLADGVTTVKPFGGVALALILIFGRNWKWPVVLAGTAGGIIAKICFGSDWVDAITIPCLTSALLLVMEGFCRRRIGPEIDFRAWKHLVRFIGLSIIVGGLSGFVYASEQNLWWPGQFWRNWHAWFMSITLSYVAFTPLTVLLATTQPEQLWANRRPLAAGLIILAAALVPCSCRSRCRCFSSCPSPCL